MIDREQIRAWAEEIARESRSIASLVGDPLFDAGDALEYARLLERYASSVRRLVEPAEIAERSRRIEELRRSARLHPDLRAYYAEKIRLLIGQNEAAETAEESEHGRR